MRGDLYRLRTPRDTVGHEQRGQRFAVVVQSDLLKVFSTVLVAPTSTSAREADFRSAIDIDGKTTKVLLDQTIAVDPQRLGDFAGRLSSEELDEVDTALRLVFGLFW
ncbi:type II toxin-antitoxin system PemK/MazF family toxin [Nonomuraea glycinis]|uniref:type II toxin-antitoxin system PemK/MazF family toxin n=1 Tax=Nonomuraea glycinis TaxID=2047744 RepID=UPI0033BC1067